jgi:hypothetical protein
MRCRPVPFAATTYRFELRTPLYCANARQRVEEKQILPSGSHTGSKSS